MSSDKLLRFLVSKPEQLNRNSSDVKSNSIAHKLDAVMVTDEASVIPISNNIW